MGMFGPVIPGHRAAMNPESRSLWREIPGSMLAHRPGMTSQFSLVASLITLCKASPCIRAMSS
jgi:hypothetical protein